LETFFTGQPLVIQDWRRDREPIFITVFNFKLVTTILGLENSLDINKIEVILAVSVIGVWYSSVPVVMYHVKLWGDMPRK
jgi:hypothetical protein